MDFQKGIRILTIEEGVNEFPLPVVIGILAHEFAHLYLHCKPGVEVSEFSEQEANSLVNEWGLGNYLKEAREELSSPIQK